MAAQLETRFVTDIAFIGSQISGIILNGLSTQSVSELQGVRAGSAVWNINLNHVQVANQSLVFESLAKTTGETFTGTIHCSGGLELPAGATLTVSSGGNQRAGIITLAGAVTIVSNATVTAKTLVFLSRQGNSGISTAGYVVNPGAGFVINSVDGDNSIYSYFLVENP